MCAANKTEEREKKERDLEGDIEGGYLPASVSMECWDLLNHYWNWDPLLRAAAGDGRRGE